MPDDVSQYITLDPTKLAEALQAAQADAYAGGSLAALQVLPDGADPGPAAYFGPDPKQAWDSWNPGNVDAANLLENGGFQSLLDQSDITIKGITSSTMDRMATILADGAVAGDSIDAIAGRLYDYLGDSGRAFTIANTEIARATEAASLDRYQANGVTQWEWVLSDDACPECQDMYDNNPHSLEEDQPPLHPNCRCTTAPIVPQQ